MEATKIPPPGTARHVAPTSGGTGRLTHAAIEMIVGLFVAVVIALAALHSPLGQAGADLSQRILLWLNTPGGALGVAPHDTHSPLRAPPTRWVFVDLADRFCDMPQARRCPPAQLRSDRAALAKLIYNLREQKPRLVVLDVLTDRTTASVLAERSPPASSRPMEHGQAKGLEPPPSPDDALRAELTRPGPPMLLAWFPTFMPTSGAPTQLNANDQTPILALASETGAPARYLPSLRAMDGPVARRLEPSYLVTQGQRTWRSPGLAFGAALVIRAPAGGSPWALLDRFDPARTATACRLVDVAFCADYSTTQRVFSFPARRPGQEPGLTIADRNPAYLRLDLGPDDRVTEDVADAVVVIGDSRQEAGDRTWSAIRDVSGAELMLNDIRQYAVAPPAPAAGPLARLAEEWPFFVAGMAAIFAAHAILNTDATQRAAGGGSVGRTVRRAVASLTALIVIAVFSAVLYALLLVFLHPHFGRPLDFVTPFVTVLLEAAFDLAHRTTQFLHASLHRLIGFHDQPEASET